MMSDLRTNYFEKKNYFEPEMFNQSDDLVHKTIGMINSLS